MCVVLLDLGAPPFVCGSNIFDAFVFVSDLLVDVDIVLFTVAQRIVDMWRPLATRHSIFYSMVRVVPM